MKSTSIQIIETLRKAGHEAYLAGGCVRDMLLDIFPKDFDIATSATPDEIEDLLEHTIPVGKQFGVIIAVQNNFTFEIATFRSDKEYKDGRRPESVEFTDAKTDALRRDFTINALFYDPIKEEVIDYVDGQNDLKQKLIRFIGDPEQRIKEDHLRILRAVRFKNAYNFQYHPDTYQAIRKYVHLIGNISKERIADELNKMIMTTSPGQAFEELFEIGALDIILPELVKLKGLAQPLEFHKEGDVWDHSIRALNSLTNEEIDPNPLPAEPASLELKWAVLFHDIGKFKTFSEDEDRIRYNSHCEVGAKIAKEVLNRLKFPKKSVDKVAWLITHHMMVVPFIKMPTHRKRHWFLHPNFSDLLELIRADALGIIPTDLSAYEKIKKLYHHEIAHLKLLPKQLIAGEDIMKILNLKTGIQVGKVIERVRQEQLKHKIKTKKDALNFVKGLKKSIPFC
jgi:poly(A) polymerase